MATVNVLQFEKNGLPLEVLHAAKVPKPQITKDTEVLVRVKAAPINPSDLGYIKGSYNPVQTFPAIPGYEGAGVVEEVGAAVKNVKVGQRVHFQKWNSTWAEYTVVDTTLPTFVVVPENISFEKAAQFTVNPITAYGLLDALNVQKGEFFLQTAAASALGKMLIVIAKRRGIKTINVVRRADHVEELKKLGGDYVINTATESIKDKVLEITNGAGVKYAVDAVGGETGTQVISALGLRGTVLLYGRLAAEPFAIPLTDIISKSLRVSGFFLGHWVQDNIPAARKYYEELIQLVSEGALSLDFQPFDAVTQFKEAIQHSLAPGKGEKTILLF